MDDSKQAFRLQVNRNRRELSSEEIQAKSHQIALNLFQTDEYLTCRHALVYMATPLEVQTKEVMQDSWRRGKSVYIPIVDKSSKSMGISLLTGLDIGFDSGPFGIKEPKREFLNMQVPSVLDLVIAPGLAFDYRGGRIGYGGGYYDRYMKTVSKGTPLLALSFDFQVFESLPQAEWDVSAHKVITESRVIEC